MRHRSGPDVCFVAHATDRSGPPWFLLRLLRWMSEHSELRPAVFAMRGGPLAADFADVAPLTVIGEPAEPYRKGRRHQARIAWSNRSFASVAPLLTSAPVLYLNTAWTGRMLAWLPVGPRPKVLTHVHELDEGFARLLPRRDLDNVLGRTDRFLVGAPEVADNLVRHGVRSDCIGLHRYFVDDEVLGGVGSTCRPEAVPLDALVVGGAGVDNWRKGPDLFTRVVAAVVERVPHDGLGAVHAVWVGGRPGGPNALCVPGDIERLGLAGRVHFVGEQPDLLPWARGFDVLAVTAREDAFPLAALEAAALGVPIVTFNNGGIPSLVLAAEGGAVVRLFDTEGMAKAVADLLTDPAGRAAAGRRLRDHVSIHHRSEAVAPALVAEIEALQ